MGHEHEPAVTTQVAALIATLVEARRHRGLSQRALGRHLGLSPYITRHWETRLDLPSTANFIRWAHALDHHVLINDPTGRTVAHCAPRPAHATGHDPITTALRQARTDAGFTQASLAAELNVTTWTLSMWEAGKRHAGLLDLAAWTERLSHTIALKATAASSANTKR
jgi:transcriptional regulator with XRE-family HTH domain